MSTHRDTVISDAPQPLLDETNHVIVVGGGHVGLSLSLSLAKQGARVTLLESRQYPNQPPQSDTTRNQITDYLDGRNTALSRRTVQIYQELGLWRQLQQHACRIDSVLISEKDSFGKATLKSEEEKVESFGYVMENRWLGYQLLQAAQANPAITVIDNATVTNLSLSTNQASVSYQPTDVAHESSSCDTQRQLSARLVVAADGQDSPSRQQLGIATTDYDYQQTAIVAVVQTDKPHRHQAIERFSEVGPLAVLPLPEIRHKDGSSIHRRSVVFVCPKGEEAAYLADETYFLQTLQQVFGQQAGQFLQAGKRSAYPLIKRLAKQQTATRCVILGNAAHTLHPVAGQGFNLCMRDVEALANRVGSYLRHNLDIGDPALLADYVEARRTDQKRVIVFCDGVVRGFSHPNPMLKLARNVGLVLFDTLPGFKPLVASYAMGLKSL